MSETIYYSGSLTQVTCWCGIRHAVPTELSEMQDRQHRDGREQIGIYCPIGHSHIHAGEGEAKRLREELERERRSRKATLELLAAEGRSHAATRGHLTRTQKRVQAGVCPCCNRTFQQLSRHMKTKHPDFTP